MAMIRRIFFDTSILYLSSFEALNKGKLYIKLTFVTIQVQLFLRTSDSLEQYTLAPSYFLKILNILNLKYIFYAEARFQ